MSRALKIHAGLVGVLMAGLVVAWFSFDPESLKPRLVAAVERATGRTLRIDGPLRLALIPGLGISAEGVALANRDGGSARPMVTVARVEAQVAWVPLLTGRVEVDRLTLVRPDVLLEIDPDGVGNWQVSRPPAAPSGSPGPAGPGGGPRLDTRIDHVMVRDGRLAWQDARNGHAVAVDIPSLTADAPSPASDLTLAATLAAHGTPIELAATTGPLAALTAAGTQWPVDVRLAAVGGQVTFKGSVADALRGRGYDGNLTGVVPELEALDAIFPHANLPRLHEVRFSAHVADGETQLPVVSNVRLAAGGSDLSALHGGLALTSLSVGLADATARIAVEAAGSLHGVPVTLDGQIGPAASLLAHQAVGVTVSGTLGADRFSVDGSVADPLQFIGVDAKVALQAADLASVAAAFPGLTVPALHGLALSSRVMRSSPTQVALQGLDLHMLQGDIAGNITFDVAGRPKLVANLTSQRLDLDGLAAMTAVTVPPAPAPIAVAPSPQPPAQPGQPVAAATDARLPFPLLRLADADLKLAAKQLIWRHATLDGLATHVVLTDGHLVVEPSAVHLGGGTLTAALQADATQTAPPVALSLQARALPAGPLLELAGVAPGITGTLDGHAQLSSTGDTLQGLAAHLDGRAGVTLVNGQIAASVAGSLLAPLLHSDGVPPGLAEQIAGARADLRCFAAAATISHGVADVGTLLLDSAALDVSGSGSLQLGAETLDFRLRPLLRLGGTGIAVPVRLTGPWQKPKAEWDGPDQQGKATFRAVIGALTKDGPSEDCGAALASARDGQAGAMPAPAPKAKPPNLGDLLKGLMK